MNVFDYAKFCDEYTKLKATIGSMEDADTSTIGGVMKSCDSEIKKGLEYAEESSWAASKVDAWNEMYPKLQTDFNNLIVLLQNAKNAADKYNEFEKQSQGM